MSTADTPEFPIIVEGLRNSFGEHVIHEDLSLKVRRGEIIGRLVWANPRRARAAPGLRRGLVFLACSQLNKDMGKVWRKPRRAVGEKAVQYRR